MTAVRSQRVIVGAILVLACAVGLWLQWAVLVAIGAGVGITSVLTFLLRFPTSATWQDVDVPARLSRGDEGSVGIRVDSLPRAGRWLSAANHATGERVFVDADAPSSQLSWQVDTSKRGMAMIGPTVLEANDPFGLRRRVFATRAQTVVLIVPKVDPVELPETFRLGPDDTEARVRGSEAFESLREYVTGDPLKLVHWKASARAGELMVRRTVDTHVPRVMVILDVDYRSYNRPGSLFRNVDEQAFERAVDLAASLCWAACTPEHRVLLATNGPDSVDIDVDLRDRESALDWLAMVDTSEEVGVGNSRLALLVRDSEPGGIVFVSGPIEENSQSLIDSLQRFGPLTVRRVSPS